MSRYYTRKNRYLIGLKNCQLFKSTASGSKMGFKCVITCVYKKQVILRVKRYGEKIRIGGIYNGWSIKFKYVNLITTEVRQ
jgi:hypothetical protein